MGSENDQKNEQARRDLVVAFTGEQLTRLKALARKLMGQERSGHTLQATALLNELWLKLAHESAAPPEDPSGTGYVRLAHRRMLQLLRNHAERFSTLKRGGGDRPVSIEPGKEEELPEAAGSGGELEGFAGELKAALGRLSKLHPDQERAVVLKLFDGLTYEQIAEVLDISLHQARMHVDYGKAFLRQQLSDYDPAA